MRKIILRLNNALNYLADSKIKQDDCNTVHMSFPATELSITQPEIFLKKVQKGLNT